MQMGRLGGFLSVALAALLAGCGSRAQLPVEAGIGPDPQLPEPGGSLLPRIKVLKAVGWQEGEAPTPGAGLAVQAFARDLDHPRWLYVLPNGDVLVAESNAPVKPADERGLGDWIMSKFKSRAGAGTPSADRITLLRDTDTDGVADQRSVFLADLYSPFGMALVGGRFYVANADGVVSFPYEAGDRRIRADGTPVADLPGGPLNNHWTKNIIASPDGSRLYATVGSNSNIGEHGLDHEEGRAAIWEINLADQSKRLFASGLRNPNGLAWEPATGALWVTVNERDMLGGDLVPDYMTSVQNGGFYGWPWSYFGQHVDERVEPARPDLVAQAIKPDYALGAHTASLGLAWGGKAELLPAQLREGMFVGQHGSWNRDPPSGYKVLFIPFAAGRPAGDPIDVLTGFLNEKQEQARGRPVGVAVAGDGALLVADDAGNVIWRVTGQ